MLGIDPEEEKRKQEAVEKEQKERAEARTRAAAAAAAATPVAPAKPTPTSPPPEQRVGTVRGALDAEQNAQPDDMWAKWDVPWDFYAVILVITPLALKLVKYVFLL